MSARPRGAMTASARPRPKAPRFMALLRGDSVHGHVDGEVNHPRVAVDPAIALEAGALLCRKLGRRSIALEGRLIDDADLAPGRPRSAGGSAVLRPAARRAS